MHALNTVDTHGSVVPSKCYSDYRWTVDEFDCHVNDNSSIKMSKTNSKFNECYSLTNLL
jgi:hypothetical protein